MRPFDGGLRADGHEDGRLDGAVRSVQQAGAGACDRTLRLNFESESAALTHDTPLYRRAASAFVSDRTGIGRRGNLACNSLRDEVERDEKTGNLDSVAGGLLCCAGVPNPTQRQSSAPVETGQPAPIFRVTVVSRTTKAINYHHRTGTTKVDFRGTELLPPARGDAKVDSQMGSTKIDAHFDHLTAANQFGPEYLTYVLWAITPEGRANNLGEVVLEGDHAHLLSTTDLQAFGLIVTAEPYFAVTQPSDVVVMENFIRNDTTGTIEQVDAKYELLQRGQYVLNRGCLSCR